MTDFRRREIAATLAEAARSERRGWACIALALALTMCAGAVATGSHVVSAVLAVWACWPLAAAVTWWLRAADDRALAAWMGSLS